MTKIFVGWILCSPYFMEKITEGQIMALHDDWLKLLGRFSVSFYTPNSLHVIKCS